MAASISPTHATPPAAMCVKGFEPSHIAAIPAAKGRCPVSIEPVTTVPATICTVRLFLTTRTCGSKIENAAAAGPPVRQ